MSKRQRPPRDYIGALTALCNTEMWNHMEPETQELCTTLLLKYSGEEVFHVEDLVALGNRRVRFMVDSETNLFTAFLATWDAHKTTHWSNGE